MESNETPHPDFCSFCEDKTNVPSVGRMVIVEMPVDKEIISYEDSTYGVCEPCSQAYNGALVGKKEDTCDVLVLQFVH